jgi:O-antigen ligase
MYIENPLFGFGPSAWGDDFRANHGMSFAFHAHNQVLHTLSVSGVVGFAGLTFYFIALSIRAFSLRHQTSGVSVAMVLGLIYPRMLTEVPLNVDVILSDNLLVHLAVFYFLCAAARGGIGSLSTASRPDRVPASPADRAFFTR